MNKILRHKFLLFGLLTVIALLYNKYSLDPVLHIRFLAVFVYLVFLGLFFLIQKSADTKATTDKNQVVLYCAYLLVSLVSLFYYQQNTGEGIFEWLRLSMPFLLICLLQSVIKKEAEVEDSITFVFMLTISISAVFGTQQYYELYKTGLINHNSIYKVSALFAHKNIYSEVCLICLPFAVYCFFSGNRFVKYAGLITSVVALFFITILLSRAIWVALLLAGLISVLVYLVATKEKKYNLLNLKKIGLVMGGFFLVIIFSVVLFSKQDTVVTFYRQFTSTFDFTHDSTKDRIELWKKTWSVFMENPWIGKGLGSWKVEILKYGNLELRSSDNTTFYQRPHNDFLWILAEQGLIAFFLFAAIAGLFYRYLFRLLKMNLSAKERNFVMALLYALTAYFLFSLFSFPRERVEHMIFFALLGFGIMHLYRRKAEGTTAFTMQNQKKIVATIVVLSFFGTYVGYTRLRSEIHNRKAFVARQNMNWDLLKKEIDLSDNFYYRFDPTSTPLRWYKGMANFNQGNVKEALVDFEEAYVVNPYHPYVLSNIATCQELLGQHDNALLYYEKALAVYPKFEDAIFNSAAIQYNLGKTEEAYKMLRKIDPDSRNPKYQPYAELIVKPQIKYISDTISHIYIKRRLMILYNTYPWWFDEFKASVRKQVSFERQLAMHLHWVFENIEKNDTLAARSQQITSKW